MVGCDIWPGRLDTMQHVAQHVVSDQNSTLNSNDQTRLQNESPSIEVFYQVFHQLPVKYVHGL